MLTQHQRNELMFYNKQLYDFGYSPNQVKELIKNRISTTNLDDLNEDQYCHLISSLEDHVIFARHCKAY